MTSIWKRKRRWKQKIEVETGVCVEVDGEHAERLLGELCEAIISISNAWHAQLASWGSMDVLPVMLVHKAQRYTSWP